MKTITYKLKDLEEKKEKKVTLKLGYVGENEHVQIRIDCAEIWKDYPAAVASLAVEPPEGEKYPAIVTRDGDMVCWTVKDSDVAHDGDGRIQLTFTEGSEIQKTVICRTKVDESIVGSGTAPDPIADFVSEANEALAELEAAEVHGPVIGEDGYWYTWSKDAGEYVKTDTKAQGEDGQQGPAGKDGADGAPGQDGHTPVKGTDYWTQQDQADIVAAAALETVSAVIDDTAGDGDTNKTWSADKIAETTGQLLNAIQGVEDLTDSENVTFQYELEVGAINGSGENVDTLYYTDSSCRTAGYIDIEGTTEIHLTLNRKENAPLPEGITHFVTYINYYDKNNLFISRNGGNDITSIDDDSIPANAKYARVSFTFTRLRDVLSSSLNGVKLLEASEIVNVVNSIKDLRDEKTLSVNFEYTLEQGAINSSGVSVDDYDPGSGDGFYLQYCCRTAGYIDISGSISLLVNLTRAAGATMPGGVDHFYTYLFFYDAYKAFISRTGGADVTEIDTDSIPEGTKYARISFTYTKLQDVAYSSFTGEKVIGRNIPIVQKVKRLDGLSITVPQKGIVLGDSISFGLWSYWDGDQRKNADDIYPNIEDTAAPIRISDWLAQYYGIPIDNIAKRGTGWVADTRNLGNAWAKAQATDFSQYDLVALCYGVNDYIQKCTMGSIENNTVGTIIGNMIHTLEKIYTDNPLAKVVVFSPLNTWGQCRSTVQNPVYYGDASTHYALGYDFNGSSFTLQALIDAMESVCDRYDVRHVVMSQGCTINVFNIKDILIDGLHPSQESMKSIASDMYHEMMFR